MVIGVVALGCEREGRDYAGAKAPLTSYEGTSVEPSVSAVARVSHVEQVAPKGPSSGPDGAVLYQTHCVACHQVTGQGVPTVFPPLDGSAYVTGENVERLASIMLYGLVGPIKVKGTVYNNAMAPFGPTLKDDELAAIATYIRSSWSNKAGPVDAQSFTQARTKWASRGPFNISELGEES